MDCVAAINEDTFFGVSNFFGTHLDLEWFIMNRFFIKKLVTAIMIISVLLILLVNNLINVYPAIKDILVDFNIKR